MGYKKTDKCILNAFEDERLFVLMARDATAPMAICEWIKFNLATQPPDKLHEALDAAIEMRGTCLQINDRKKFKQHKKHFDEMSEAIKQSKSKSKGKDEELE